MATRTLDLDLSEELVTEFGENATYVAELLARYRTNPDAVDADWRAFFQERLGGAAPAPSAASVSPPAPVSPVSPGPAAAALSDASPPSAPAASTTSTAPPASTASTASTVAPAPAAPASRVDAAERIPIRGAALRLVQNMEASLGVPTATSQRQIPIKLLDENRRLVNEYRAINGQGKVSFTHLVGWAVLQALKAHPRLNDSFDENGGAPVRVRRDRVGFGLAVDVEKSDGTRSLLVPDIKGAESLSFAGFAAAADDLIARARKGKLQVADFEGTTISLTNPGTLGTTASVPRLMPGQGLIVATGAIEYPAEFSAMDPEALSRLAISKVVTFTSTYDHRIIQGAESGLFLSRIEDLLLGKHGFYESVFSDLGIPYRPLHWATDRNSGVFSTSRSAEIEKQAHVLELINAYRVRGHLIADIDPLRLMPVQNHPELDLETYGLTIWDLDRSFWTGGLSGREHMPLREIIALMRRVYCGKVGIEYRFISNPVEKEWIRRRVGAQPEPLAPEVRRRLLRKLIEAETFERFLGTRFLGQRRYSIEGSETAIAFLDQLLEGAAARGVDEVTIGLTHRGRLNILANVVGNAAERIFSGFQGTVHPDFPADEGDVKYHQGARAKRMTESGREIAISVPSNPSHLEAVDPIVEGRVRAKQDRTGLPREEAWLKILPVLLHGDAAFAGQGIVAEVFNLAQLRGYRTGGTIHLIVNNQIGFTTDPATGRSSVYSTDVAKINQVPIFHVNGGDPEAAWRVLQIALDYRQEYHKDVVVDLIGFRLHGHNEGDEPTYTQPLMYRRIQENPGVRTLYARRLIAEGVLTEAEVQELEAKQIAFYESALTAATEAAKRPAASSPAAAAPGVDPARLETASAATPTAVPRETLAAIGRALTTVPAGFNLNPKMVQQLARRAKMTDGSTTLDWATAEGLAFGSLLLEGRLIRMSGQDTGRGTFSQRHVVFYDTQTSAEWIPLCHLGPGQGPFHIFNSPLSEMAVLGFEYGYSVERPDGLVIWEAQYGDFANGAQVIIDQFITSAEDKWRETSRLSLLLPHGYEGQGPEHSSARIERYLQLCADDNIQVCNLTTPAQYFHLLRRQELRPAPKPLVLFTPKSLLRLPVSFSPLEDLASGGFHAWLDDADARDRASVRRILLCSGKVYYDLKAAREERKDNETAILRVEQLYPFPAEELRRAIASYPSAKDVVWVQEEARNMGAWSFAAPLVSDILPRGARLRYAGRAASAAVATGNANVHKRELAEFLVAAFRPETPVDVEKTLVMPRGGE